MFAVRKSVSVVLLACLVASALSLGISPSAFGQGFLLPEAKDDVVFRMPRPIIAPEPWPGPRPIPQPRDRSYKIKEIAMDVAMQDQVAKVQVSQAFVNTGNVQLECSFVYPLPHDGAIDSLTFMVDGKEFEGKLMNADEARQIYQSYVQRNIDPALMEWIGTGMFKTSVFPVPPGKERKVTLKYSQLCPRENGVTEMVFPLRAAQYSDKAVENLALKVHLTSTKNIKNVYSPSHPMQMERSDNKHATLTYEGTNEIPNSDFRLLYDIGDKAVGASVLSYRPKKDEDGYYLMLVSPEIKEKKADVARKQMIFVVDRSGSMSGKKMEQAKGALKFVLNNLNEGDLFNIIAYDSVVESYKPELQKYSTATRDEAIGWVNGMYAGGSTNIDGALKAAFGQLKDDTLPSYVIFLTDGMPTAGETKMPAIVGNAAKNNKLRSRVFSFGVGYDVNSRLLDKLSRECFGQSEYVRPDDDIEVSVSELYAKIGSPVLTDVNIAWEMPDREVKDGPVVNRVYPAEAYDLFVGEQLVMVGRYRVADSGKVTISGEVGGKEQTFDFQASLVEKSNDESNAFIEKLWAMRRVGQIIDEIDLIGKNEELIGELIDLSKKHGIMTPYTAFLAEEPLDGRRGIVPVDALERAELQLEALDDAVGGQGGFAQRDFKAELKQANQAAAPAAAKVRAADKDEEVVLNTVKSIGTKTFFFRGDRWVDSSIDEEKLKDAKQVKRFSDAYFDLITKHGNDVAKYLAIEGKVVIQLDDAVYEF